MAKFLSANVVAQKPGFQKQWLPYPPKGEFFLERKKTTNFERIAHLNTEFDSPKEAHFKTGKTEKNEVISFQYPSESNLTAHSFPTPIISCPNSPCVLMRPHQVALSNKQSK